jgi:hypothetical protein
MGSTTGWSDGLRRAKDLAVEKVHTLLDFRVVEPYLADSCSFRGGGLPEAVSLPNMGNMGIA